MNSHEITALHGFFEADQFDADLLCASWRHIRVVTNQVRAKTGETLSNERTDSTKADDADGLFIELDTGEL